MSDDTAEYFIDRPSLSPVLATLYVAGMFHGRSRFIDVGCGKGIDCLSLSSIGYRSVYGVDDEPDFLDTARDRARQLGLSRRVKWHLGKLPQCLSRYRDGFFDVVIDTLTYTNVCAAGNPTGEENKEVAQEYSAQLRRITSESGVLVLSIRSDADYRFTRLDPSEEISVELLQYFNFNRCIFSHIPDVVESRSVIDSNALTHGGLLAGHVGVIITIGTPKKSVSS